ncbi:hypothetical protein GHT09_013818 [Marmota monax]|uniref:Uncharacterized protein n=1 Tax=Marmota monax TaxID=9995 RepID=A0A834PL77_MARMO|nr:hypothetical protein GHT09_013818 [Marmota monax]
MASWWDLPYHRCPLPWALRGCSLWLVQEPRDPETGTDPLPASRGQGFGAALGHLSLPLAGGAQLCALPSRTLLMGKSESPMGMERASPPAQKRRGFLEWALLLLVTAALVLGILYSRGE